MQIQHGDIQSVVKMDGENIITGSVQDCTPILEHATKLRNEGYHGSKEMKHAASFPAVIVEKYCNLHGIDFAEFMREKIHIRRMLQDPDLSGFRVWGGRVC